MLVRVLAVATRHTYRIATVPRVDMHCVHPVPPVATPSSAAIWQLDYPLDYPLDYYYCQVQFREVAPPGEGEHATA